MIEFLTTMPAPAMKPIIDVAVKKAPMSACPGQDADEGQGDGREDDQGREERLEPPHDHDVDQDEHGGEGDPQVPEDLVGDVPFAVPLHGVPVFEPGLHRRVLLQFVALGQLQLLYRPHHREYGIDGALLPSRHVAHHVDHPLQVLPVDGLVLVDLPAPSPARRG